MYLVKVIFKFIKVICKHQTNTIKMKTIITLILISFSFISGQSQSAELSLKLENGKEYKQVTNSKATIIQEFDGQKMDMGMTINGTMSFLVKASNENGYSMETKFEKLSMSMQLPHGTLEFCSEKNDDNDIFSKILGSMKNKTFEVTMSKLGKITEVKNVEALWESAINQFDFLPEMQK